MTCKLLLIVLLPCTFGFPRKIPVGGLFDDDGELQKAFEFSVKIVNRNSSILFDVRQKFLLAKSEQVTTDALEVSEKACKLLSTGVAGILGPRDKITRKHVNSICETMDIPCMMTKWNANRLRGHVINFYPDAETLSAMVHELMEQFEWKNFALLYENTDGLIRLSGLLKQHTAHEFHITVHSLGSGPSYREALWEMIEAHQTNIVIDCSIDNLAAVLEQIQEDFHTLNLDKYKYSGAEIIGIRLVDPDNPFTQQIYTNNSIDWNLPDLRNLRVESALVYDAVQLFAKGFARLESSIRGSIDRLPCNGSVSWGHGISLSNFIRSEEVQGLTGMVKFNSQGYRTDFHLDLIYLSINGIESSGSWNLHTGLHLRDIDEPPEKEKQKSLRKRHFTVLIPLTEPYGMWKKSAQSTRGNDRYEGFAVDIIKALSESLGFNYTFQLQADNVYGSFKKGQWNGMLRKIMDGEADLAIADLTITSERESAVDFTVPFMNLGISILYRKPTKAPPSMLAFLAPYQKNVWYSITLSFLVVSVILFIVGRLCPAEWRNPYPCVEVPTTLTNQITLNNAFWLTIGSILQQGTEVMPAGISTRGIATIWCFFRMAIVASYTANLAAFLTAKQNIIRFENIEQLAKRDDIPYGAKKDGATLNFFETSSHPTYHHMYQRMMEDASYVLTASNEEGVKKVTEDDYAFLMESSAIEYFAQRDCDIQQVGGLLDAKSYGIAMKKGSPYRHEFNAALLRMTQTGQLKKIEDLWWKQRRGGGKCTVTGGDASHVKALTMVDVGGVFVFTMSGCALSFIWTVCTFLWSIRTTAIEKNTHFRKELVAELKFLMTGKGTKIVDRRRRQPLEVTAEDIKSLSS